MPRIHLTKAPFTLYRGAATAITIRETGEHDVADEVAQAAIARGHATLMEPKKATRAARSGKPESDAAANEGHAAGVDRTDLAPDDRADGGASLADAG